jgi:acyl-CoA synthetase (AMP-forming)/AMP-acid ligase II
MHQSVSALGGRFFVMYGQTEAAPRITTLPHERLLEKLGSVGPALPGGRLSILDEDGASCPPGVPGRVVYDGANVMLGYAHGRPDLALGDVMGGRLETGDLGWLDVEGYLTLTGRSKRIAKLHGLRLNLEEVEARFAAAGEVAAAERGDKILLFTAAPEVVSALVPVVAAEYKVPAASFGVRPQTTLPRKASGKIDYAALESMT